MIQTSEGPRTAVGVVDLLTYRNYAFNRAINPTYLTALRMARCFDHADALEARYQKDGPRVCAHCRRGLDPLPAALMADPAVGPVYIARGRLCQTCSDRTEVARGMGE